MGLRRRTVPNDKLVTELPGLELREGVAEDLPFLNKSFDSVVSGFGIGDFSKPERVLDEFARVLVPNGWVAVSW